MQETCFSSHLQDQSSARFFSQQALDNAAQKLKKIKVESSFSLNINFSTFQLNAPKVNVSSNTSVANDLRKQIISSMILEDVSRDKFYNLHNQSLIKAQEHISEQEDSKKSILLLFSVGVYYDQNNNTPAIYSFNAFGAVAGADVPVSIKEEINQFTPSISVDLTDSSWSTNDFILNEFINYVEQIVLPAKRKNYILFQSRKYFTSDTLFVFGSEAPFQFAALNHENIPFGDQTVWEGAVIQQNKSKAIFDPKRESDDMSGSIVSATSNNSSVTIRVVVVQIKYAQSIFDSYGFDDNDPVACEKYPSYQTSPIKGIPWKFLPSDNQFVPVEVIVKPFGAEKKLTFSCSNSSNFKLKSPKVNYNYFAGSADPEAIELQIHIASSSKNKETSVIPKIDGVASKYNWLNAASYGKLVKQVTVVMVEEENDDVQLIPLDSGNLDPMAPIIGPGRNKVLDGGPRWQSDDSVVFDAQLGDSVIVAGRNGICETEAVSQNVVFNSDVQVDLTELEKTLNYFYRKFQVEWKVDKVLHKKLINYDLDGSGKLDIGYFMEGKFVKTKEEILVYEARNKSISHNLIFVEAIHHTTLYARTTGDLKSTIVFVDNFRINLELPNSGDLMEAMYETCGHELGHMAFQLVDLVSLTKDYYNLMSWNVDLDINVLRKFQWDIIHGLKSPDSQAILYK